MVQLFIKSPCAPGATPEWMLIELQGVLESPDDEQLTGRFIGDLHFNHKGIPILIIGHHILYGKVNDLEKPFLVLMKNENAAKHLDIHSDIASSANDAGDQMEVTPSIQDEAHFHVNAIVRRKMVFKTRPKPIITNVPKKV